MAEAIKPVIRIPKRKPSLIPQNTHHSDNGHDGSEIKEFLVSDTLFLSRLPQNIREGDIRTILQHCMPTEMYFDRENNTGYLRFSHPKIADRAYSLYNGFTFANDSTLDLQMYQDGRLDPEPSDGLLEINNLPEHFDENKLYDVFRPFGPLNLCRCVKKDGYFRAYLQFFSQADSEEAVKYWDGHVIDGCQLSIISLMPTKTHAAKEEISSDTKSDTNGVDMLNLYIKNLDPTVNSQLLNQIFRQFGRIISARVMTNPATGQSKGYGFVSFSKSEEAAAALHEMNGYMLGNRPLLVNYHEPRKGKSTITPIMNNMNTMSNHSNHSHQSTMNMMRPMNDMGLYHSNSYPTPNNILNQHISPSLNVQSSYISDNNHPHHPMRSINNINMDMESNLNGVKELGISHKPPQKILNTIHSLPQRKMSDINLSIANTKLSPQFTATPAAASPGRSLASLASGLSVQPVPAHLNTMHVRPTLRRRGSLESVMTESSSNIQRLKLEKAVNQCGNYGKAVDEIVDMLLTLKRKERSLCLFNPDFLKEKVQLALEALDACEGSDSEESDEEQDAAMEEYARRKEQIPVNNYAYQPPSTPTPTEATPTPYYHQERTVVLPPPVTTPPAPAVVLSAEVSESSSSESNGEPEEPEHSQEIQALLTSLEGKPVHEKKQLLGDKLFPLVKATGIKQAPKVTIHLLDSVDLYELAHIMYDTQLLMPRVQQAFNTLQNH